MHFTTTCINTTFEWEKVSFGSFHTPVCCLPSGVESREEERAFWLGSGLGLGVRSWGSIVPGLAFRLSQDHTDFLEFRSSASVGHRVPAGGPRLGSVQRQLQVWLSENTSQCQLKENNKAMAEQGSFGHCDIKWKNLHFI
ncbi:hypothetical protein ILYODFUR_024357 [Ilyodon furcidens]|uniref:Uncharacterized protein n=1 Tax=Ilyodon furcidens TaxID=33524 RepID=A0ABV0TZ12_9TELE